jgi:hypothetical protein
MLGDEIDHRPEELRCANSITARLALHAQVRQQLEAVLGDICSSEITHDMSFNRGDLRLLRGERVGETVARQSAGGDPRAPKELISFRDFSYQSGN